VQQPLAQGVLLEEGQQKQGMLRAADCGGALEAADGGVLEPFHGGVLEAPGVLEQHMQGEHAHHGIKLSSSSQGWQVPWVPHSLLCPVVKRFSSFKVGWLCATVA